MSNDTLRKSLVGWMVNFPSSYSHVESTMFHRDGGGEAARSAETATALKIAMYTLDPKRDVFRLRKPHRRQPKDSYTDVRSGTAT